MRLFIAIELPDVILTGLEEMERDLAKSGVDARWVARENRHLTLYFLGEVDRGMVPTIESAMEEAISGSLPFSITVGGIGVFPNWRAPRVLWVGVSKGQEHVISLHRNLTRALADQGIVHHDKGFTPHITLGRFKDTKANVQGLTSKYQAVEVGTFSVERISLIHSQLRPSGPIYVPISRCSS